MCHCTSVINLTSAPLVANYYLAWLSPWKGLINPLTPAVPVFTFGSDPKAILGLHNQDQFKKTKKNYCCCTDRTSEHTELFNSVFSGSARTEGCRRCVTVGSPSWAASRRIQYSIRTIISKVDKSLSFNAWLVSIWSHYEEALTLFHKLFTTLSGTLRSHQAGL